MARRRTSLSLPPLALPLLALSLLLPIALPAQKPTSKAHTNPTQQPSANTDPNWQAELQHQHDELIRRNGPGTDTALRDQLLALRDRDQQARGIANGQPIQKDKLEVAANLTEIDADLTTQLKTIVDQHGWPTITLVGIEASNAAMLLLTHTADHAWQRGLLAQLEALADAGKIDGATLALVIDKELVSEHKLQRYGTQFKFVDGAMAMYGVEDPATLDARRARVFLPPLDAYKQRLATMYHLKATDRILSPTP